MYAKKGSTLILVIIIIQIGLILSLAMMSIAKSDLMFNYKIEKKYQEEYYADAGIKAFIKYANENFGEFTTLYNKILSGEDKEILVKIPNEIEKVKITLEEKEDKIQIVGVFADSRINLICHKDKDEIVILKYVQ